MQNRQKVFPVVSVVNNIPRINNFIYIYIYVSVYFVFAARRLFLTTRKPFEVESLSCSVSPYSLILITVTISPAVGRWSGINL